eukprot:TRINITY_DN7256_c0_g5_i1.p5 TRINITY_DN7256_c0_g5~~TRINITY_DN7256_c0_g5_i1.p5  ORF type:complete len:138 (-),score=36.72 TRINITY_DN7256_c0_g5_i1:2001-2414(-)
MRNPRLKDLIDRDVYNRYSPIPESAAEDGKEYLHTRRRLWAIYQSLAGLPAEMQPQLLPAYHEVVVQLEAQRLRSSEENYFCGLNKQRAYETRMEGVKPVEFDEAVARSLRRGVETAKKESLKRTFEGNMRGAKKAK